MMSMIVMLIAVAVIIFCSVMFLMLNVTIERASFGTSPRRCSAIRPRT